VGRQNHSKIHKSDDLSKQQVRPHQSSICWSPLPEREVAGPAQMSHTDEKQNPAVSATGSSTHKPACLKSNTIIDRGSSSTPTNEVDMTQVLPLDAAESVPVKIFKLKLEKACEMQEKKQQSRHVRLQEASIAAEITVQCQCGCRIKEDEMVSPS